jgi:rfaE bifunctional protein nucleotidyltransferase chain/domain
VAKRGELVLNEYFDFTQKKLVQPHKLASFAAEVRKQNKRLVTLNGSFDLLHAGHLHIIHEASKQGDVLLVALNSDASIKRYKSPKRPIIGLRDRLTMMSALSFVTNVTWFEQDDPRDLLEIVQPDVHVNGQDWGSECIESEVVKKYGGKLHIVSLVPGLSTSKIIERIHETSSPV